MFLGGKCGGEVWISYLSLHIGVMILCPTEKSVPIQGFCCYQWCEAISRSEVLGRPAQKAGPGEQKETLGREEWKQWNEFLSTCRIQLVFCYVKPQKKCRIDGLAISAFLAGSRGNAVLGGRTENTGLHSLNVGVSQGVIFSLHIIFTFCSWVSLPNPKALEALGNTCALGLRLTWVSGPHSQPLTWHFYLEPS